MPCSGQGAARIRPAPIVRQVSSPFCARPRGVEPSASGARAKRIRLTIGASCACCAVNKTFGCVTSSEEPSRENCHLGAHLSSLRFAPHQPKTRRRLALLWSVKDLSGCGDEELLWTMLHAASVPSRASSTWVSFHARSTWLRCKIKNHNA